MQPAGPPGSRPGANPFTPPPAASLTPRPVSNTNVPRPTSGTYEGQLAPPPLGTAGSRMRGTRTPSPGNNSASPIPGTDAFSSEVASGPRLELARGDSSSRSEDTLPTRSSGSAGSLRDIGAGKASGVSMDEDPRNLDLVRCAQHGLYYDKTKASGCRKCMSLAREVAQGFESRSAQTSLKVANLRDQPAKRAFIGLAVAVVLGLLPAAYYAFGPGSANARELRVRQEVLSRQPGTEEIMHQFDELEEQVNRSRDASFRNIALVWAATSIAAMAGWYKVT